MHGCSGGVCVVAPGGHAWLLGGRGWGVHGCSWGVACMVAPGGACVVAPGGHVWLFGGHVWLLLGGVHGIRRDTEIRSMSRQYTS